MGQRLSLGLGTGLGMGMNLEMSLSLSLSLSLSRSRSRSSANGIILPRGCRTANGTATKCPFTGCLTPRRIGLLLHPVAITPRRTESKSTRLLYSLCSSVQIRII